MGKQRIISLFLCAAIGFSGCAGASGNTVTTVTAPEPTAEISSVAETKEPQKAENALFSDRDLNASYSETQNIAIVLNGSSISCDDSSVEISGTTATIQKEGTYLLNGTLTDGSVIVAADKSEKVQLVLNGVSIHSGTSAAIYVRQADKVFVTLASGTQNSLSNGGSFTADGDTNIDSVIFSKDDLTLNGSGLLTITSPGGHGIVSKDSLRLTGGSYVMDVFGHGLSGKDEVSIANGTFEIVAGKDGIHAENSEDAGFVYLENGTYQIHAGSDGISASGSCQIIDGDYTITTGGGSENGQQRTSNPGFGSERPGPGSVDAVTSATQTSGQPQNVPKREPGGGMGGGKGFEGMNQEPRNRPEDIAPAEKTDTESAKGIKAASLTIEGGRFRMGCADDGLHANGDLELLGGTLEIASGDDGIHADETVTVSSGAVTITQSYEGIEGQHILIQGGEIVLKATDDGLNAAGGVDGSGFGRRSDTFAVTDDTPSIMIHGGSVSITASGDGMDANGTLEITGGTVTVCGPTYGDTSVLDFDITGTISGGTFLGTGAASMAQTFSGGTQGVISVNVDSQSAGTQITLTDSSGSVILSHTPELDFQIVILSCPDMQSGESYTLSVGNTTQNFTAK